jgi:tetratricopeptide (TPR) repeat protein
VCLGQLGAFDEAVEIARRIDQKTLESPEIDAICALRLISLFQARAGNHDAARATLREATRVEKPPEADAQESRAMLADGFVQARGYEEAMKIAETLGPDVRATIWSQVASRKRQGGDRAGADALFRRALIAAGEFLHSPPPPEAPGPRGRVAPERADGRRRVLQLFIGDRVALERGDGPDHPGAADPTVEHQAEALTLLAQIHARAGDWTSAARTFAFLPAEDTQRDGTAFWLAGFRAHSSDLAGALEWARSLPSSSLRAWALRGLAVGIFGDDADLEYREYSY